MTSQETALQFMTVIGPFPKNLENLIDVECVFSYPLTKLVVLIDLRLRSMMKGHIVTNLLTSFVLSLQGNLRPRSEISL